MIIHYIWYENPKIIKQFDTVKDFNYLPDIFNQSQSTQEEYDQHQLELISRKKRTRSCFRFLGRGVIATINNCKKCVHFYRTMTDNNGQGYNPAPFCHYYEDTGKSPDYFEKCCFKKRPPTRRKK